MNTSSNSIFDTHAHYSDTAFDEDRDYLLSEYLPKNNIKRVLLAGCNISESEMNIELSKKYDYIYAAVGIHPETVYKEPIGESTYEWLIDTLKNNNVTALGEIGLDYHYEGYNKQWQADAFKRQLEIAKDFDLPVIIHARDATQDYLDILHYYKPRGVVHCFGGSRETAREITQKLGMYIGFTGVITFKNARKTLEAVDEVPMDRILFETDAPYLAPEPFRKKYRARCDSSMIAYTAQKAAEVKKCDVEKIIDIACENGERLFGID
jgi:TatD DNase family protein